MQMTAKKRNRAFPRFTPEEQEEFKEKMRKRRSEWTLAFQLGISIGEQIVSRYLPTLSVDDIKTRTNISVTAGEGDECRRLNDVWFNKLWAIPGDDEDAKHKATEAEWKALRDYHEMLEEKYLPKTVECSFQVLNITEEHMADFKKGVSSALWDCDCSHYSTKPEDIEVKADDDGWFTTITLKKSDD